MINLLQSHKLDIEGCIEFVQNKCLEFLMTQHLTRQRSLLSVINQTHFKMKMEKIN